MGRAEVIDSLTLKIKKLRRQLQHKRFTTVSACGQMRSELSLLPRGYWYVQAHQSIEPIGNSNDSIHQRPDCVHV